MIQLNHINNFMSHDNASSKLTLIHTNLSLTTNDNNDDFLYTKKRISKEDIIKIPNVSSQQNNKDHVGVPPVPTAPPITTDNSPSTNSSNPTPLLKQQKQQATNHLKPYDTRRRSSFQNQPSKNAKVSITQNY